MSGCGGSTGTLDLAIGAPAAALTFLYLGKVVFLLVYMIRNKVHMSLSYVLLFVGLITFLVFRAITWVLWMIFDSVMVDVIFNRLAWIAGATVLIVLLVSWMDAVHSQFPHGTERFLFWLKLGSVVFVVAYALSTIVPTIVFLVTATATGSLPPSLSSARVAYDASTWTHTGVQLLLSFAFLGYGIAIVFLIQKASHGERLQSVAVLLVSIAIVVAYGGQFGIFLVRPLGRCVPSWLFWLFGYILPVVLISMVVLYLGLQYARKEISVMASASQEAQGVPLLETPRMYENF